MRGLILCAGLGERLRPITSKLAKPAVPFLNIPMLAYPLFWLEQLGLKELLINTHYLPQTVEKAAREVCEWKYALDFLHESPEILGSGGAIWNARNRLYGAKNFIVANGDAVLLLDRKSALNDMLAYHQETRALATLLACPYPGVGTTMPGVWVNNLRDVVGFGKTAPTPNAQCLHYTGVAIFSGRILDMLPNGASNILYDVLLKEIAKGEVVNVWNEAMKWFETGKPREYLAASYECLDMLFTNDGVRWHLVDILDRFTPGWRNHSEPQIYARERLKYDHKQLEPARVLMGPDVHSSTAIMFEGRSILGKGLDLSGRTSTEGVFIPEANMWVR